MPTPEDKAREKIDQTLQKGWQDLKLDHDFYEVETFPENDRVRYAVSPATCKEVLRRRTGSVNLDPVAI